MSGDVGVDLYMWDWLGDSPPPHGEANASIARMVSGDTANLFWNGWWEKDWGNILDNDSRGNALRHLHIALIKGALNMWRVRSDHVAGGLWRGRPQTAQEGPTE